MVKRNKLGMTIKTELSDREAISDDEETRVKIFVHQMLVARIFVASYIGKFYVDSLKDYRDVIQIYNEEVDLTRDLQVVKKRIEHFHGGAVWAAITDPDFLGPPSGHCLWVSLRNIAFGNYWFVVEDTSWNKKEVVIKMKVIRKFEPVVGSSTGKDDSSNWSTMKNITSDLIKEIITWHNFKESSKFIFALLLTIASAISFGVQYLGDYSLRFFKEFNNLIKILTPIFLALLDVISKIIGGFYILIAMLWTGNNQRMPQQMSLMGPPPRAIKHTHYRRPLN